MPGKPQRIALLGSTGSIGTQALNVISRYPDKFIVESLVAGNNIDLLIRQSRQFKPEYVVIGNCEHYNKLKESLQGSSLPALAIKDYLSRSSTIL